MKSRGDLADQRCRAPFLPYNVEASIFGYQRIAGKDGWTVKKIIALLLCLAFLIPLTTGCGGDADKDKDKASKDKDKK